MYQLAGIAGVDPGQRSLRELVWMVEARRIDDWNHTAAQICWLVRMNVGKKASRVQPKHFHPFAGTMKAARRVLSKQEAYQRLNAMVGARDG